MTLDELLQQLMKIKEVYPDSGNFRVVAYNSTENKTEVVKILKSKTYDEIEIEADEWA